MGCLEGTTKQENVSGITSSTSLRGLKIDQRYLFWMTARALRPRGWKIQFWRWEEAQKAIFHLPTARGATEVQALCFTAERRDLHLLHVEDTHRFSQIPQLDSHSCEKFQWQK